MVGAGRRGRTRLEVIVNRLAAEANVVERGRRRRWARGCGAAESWLRPSHVNSQGRWSVVRVVRWISFNRDHDGEEGTFGGKTRKISHAREKDGKAGGSGKRDETHMGTTITLGRW